MAIKKHIFPEAIFAENESSVILVCEECGCECKQYLSGRKKYRVVNNAPFENFTRLCIPNAYREINADIAKTKLRAMELEKLNLHEYSFSKHFIDNEVLKSICQDQMVMIKLAYGELKNSRIKEILGRYLQSAGFNELLKFMDNNLKIA